MKKKLLFSSLSVAAISLMLQGFSYTTIKKSAAKSDFLAKDSGRVLATIINLAKAIDSDNIELQKDIQDALVALEQIAATDWQKVAQHSTVYESQAYKSLAEKQENIWLAMANTIDQAKKKELIQSLRHNRQRMEYLTQSFEGYNEVQKIAKYSDILKNKIDLIARAIATLLKETEEVLTFKVIVQANDILFWQNQFKTFVQELKKSLK